MQVTRYNPGMPEWGVYTAHLRANNQAVWVLDENDAPFSENLIYLGIEQQ